MFQYMSPIPNLRPQHPNLPSSFLPTAYETFVSQLILLRPPQLAPRLPHQPCPDVLVGSISIPSLQLSHYLGDWI